MRHWRIWNSVPLSQYFQRTVAVAAVSLASDPPRLHPGVHVHVCASYTRINMHQCQCDTVTGRTLVMAAAWATTNYSTIFCVSSTHVGLVPSNRGTGCLQDKYKLTRRRVVVKVNVLMARTRPWFTFRKCYPLGFDARFYYHTSLRMQCWQNWWRQCAKCIYR